MEGSSSTSTSVSHFRSISLPSRLTHPSHILVQKKINELKAWGNMVCSSQTIQYSLAGLVELYDCVDELLQSPHTQQALSRHQIETLGKDVFERSIVLLDSCNILKEFISLMKENVQVLQSALRRKAGDLANQIASYVRFRKNMKKSIIKSLETLKSLEKKMTSIPFQGVDSHVSMVIKVLGEVIALTISLFKIVLVFLSPKSKPTNGVQLLSKLVLKVSTTHGKSNLVNEVDTVDMATMCLHKSAKNNEINDSDVYTTLKKMQILGISIEGFEVGLNCLFRRLIQHRVSLLNVVSC